MPAKTPEEAVDAFLERFRSALGCVVRATILGSGYAPGRKHSVTAFGQGLGGMRPMRLHTHGGVGELGLRILHFYAVGRDANDAGAGYSVFDSFHHHDILDRDGREIVVFHWEPEGRGPVREPHLHMPAAEPVVLPQRGGSPLAGAKTHLGNLHLPTGEIGIEAVVELLIRDFAVDPLRADWSDVLAASRARRGA